MSEKKPEFAMWFHKFLINGMLWICGIGLILIGVMNSHIAIEDGVSPLILVILMQVILAASGLTIIKARFDLAKMKAAGLKLLLIAFLAAAVAMFVDWRIYELNGELFEKSFIYPLVSACWGIAIYRYYRQFDVLE